MAKRTGQLNRILNYRNRHEQLCRRRAVICRCWLQAAEKRLRELQEAVDELYVSPVADHIPNVQWHQQQQRSLDMLRERMVRVQRLDNRLRQRLSHRQSQVTGAAQLRRAIETALARLEQQAIQVLRQNQNKESDELARRKLLDRTPNPHVIAT